MGLKGFKGGIHPPENKHFTRNLEFSHLTIPQTCFIPLQQHIGKPAKPVVEAGSIVEEGQLIAASDGLISSNVHASVPGKVTAIVDHPTIYSPKGKCIVIEAEGSFSRFGAVAADPAWESLDKSELIKRVKQAGIVGLGGAAFPSSVKLTPPETKTLQMLIVNGAECEPYVTVDDMLMKTFPVEIIEGIRITLKILGIRKAVIGIEKNKPGAIASLNSVLKKSPPAEAIDVMPLNVKYPQGAEKQLIRSITGREVPSRALPMDVGAVIHNVSTIFAIREAVLLGKPLFERYVTVTGKTVRRPGNYKIRVGTRISDIISEIGGLSETPAKVIMGGPMCGISLDSLEVPVIKATNGILFLSRDEVKIQPIRPCIRCGRCVSVCPAGLIPCEIGTAAEANRFDLVGEYQPFDCIMCGSCSYVCPSKRPLSHFIRLAQQVSRSKK